MLVRPQGYHIESGSLLHQKPHFLISKVKKLKAITDRIVDQQVINLEIAFNLGT